MTASSQLKIGGSLVATLSTPILFSGSEEASFTYDFKPNTGSKGVSQTLVASDSKNGQVFTIKMGGAASVPPYMVWVNGVSLGLATRSTAAIALNSIKLTLKSTGVSATMTYGTTTIGTVNVPVLGGINFAKFTISPEVNTSTVDYDNFQVWQVSKAPPPPRLDLYMLLP